MRASALSSVMASLTDLLPAKILAPWSANVDDNVNARFIDESNGIKPGIKSRRGPGGG